MKRMISGILATMISAIMVFPIYASDADDQSYILHKEVWDQKVHYNNRNERLPGWYLERTNNGDRLKLYDTGESQWNRSGWYCESEMNVLKYFYFDENGYLLTNTVTPDGYSVNEYGEWTVDGQVWIKERWGKSPFTNEQGMSVFAPYRILTGNEVEDGASIDRMQIIQRDYSDESYQIKDLISGIPETGIEYHAFYDNLIAPEAWAGVDYNNFNDSDFRIRSDMTTSTGMSDEMFGFPQASYYYSSIEYSGFGNTVDIMFLLTEGSDGRWYIFPENKAFAWSY